MITVLNSNVIGVLASDESVQHAIGKPAIFKNTQNVLQFYVRIISKIPDSFASAKFVTFFGTDLEKWGFEGDHLEETEGRKALQHFLAENLIVFKPKRKVLYDGTEVYDGQNLTLIPKSEYYHEGVSLTPLPMFSEEDHGIPQVDLEERLCNQQSIGKMEGISNDDIPHFILWKKSESDFIVYGEFSGRRYGDEGFSFTHNKKIKSASFEEEWLDYCYEHEDTVYVPYEIYTYIDGTISAAEPLSITAIHEEIQPTSTTFPVEKNDGESTTSEMLEEELMKAFIHTTRVEGLLYDEKDLYNFHTAIKSSNLVILAGMSGTGKSQLVKAYGKSLGLEAASQVTFIPVRPAWTDDARSEEHTSELQSQD